MRIYSDGKGVAFETPEDFEQYRSNPSDFKLAREFGFNFNPDLKGLEFPQIISVMIRQEIKGQFDLSQFPNLKYLDVNKWNKKLEIRGSEQMHKLRSIYLPSFKPLDNSLIQLEKFPVIEQIEIIGTNITSLQGLEKLITLKRLTIEDGKKVKDISPLIERGRTLNAVPLRFNLTNNKVLDWTPLINLAEDCPQIIDLVFVNCIDIPSLSFLKHFPGLRSLSIHDTLVLDGDMSPGQHLLRFWHDNKRTYNLKCAHDNLGWEGIERDLLITKEL